MTEIIRAVRLFGSYYNDTQSKFIFRTFMLSRGAMMKVSFNDKQKQACETEKDTAVFYAGATYDGACRYNASSAANNYAEAVGGTTIDMNFEKSGIEWSEDREIGRQLSKMYAENASGDVKVFLGDNDSYNKHEESSKDFDVERHPLNTWDTTECPALLANDKVTSITVYDPKTQQEIVVCDREIGDGSTESMVKQYNEFLASKGSEIRYGINKDGSVSQHTEYAVKKETGHIKERFASTIKDMCEGYDSSSNRIPNLIIGEENKYEQ